MSAFFPFLSNNSFLKVTSSISRLPFAIAGAAFDGATTNRSGTRFGPKAIRDASHMLCDATHPHFEVSPFDYLQDFGDVALPNTSLQSMRERLELVATEMFKTHHMVWLGGDHSITLSLLRAYRKAGGKPIGIVHFDAHCDAWSSHFDEPSGHGTWVYEAVTEGLVIPECVVQLGIRSAGNVEARNFVTGHGGLVYTSRMLRGLEGPLQLRHVFDEVRQRMALHGSPPVYLTLDIDCLDPAFAPGTGTPEAGGLTSSQVLTVLEELTPVLNFVAMDCVEVSPPYDHAEITSIAAATFVWTYLCGRMRAGIPYFRPM